jgi:DNA-binding IclR family transcriptional regulator
VLAQLPAAQVRAIFPDRSAFVLRHDVGPASLTALRGLLTQVRRRGHATEEGEITPGLSSVAAPVLDHHAHPIAGVSVTFPGDAADESERDRIADQVARTARELTHRVGGATTG